jgi:hypothetical protein
VIFRIETKGLLCDGEGGLPIQQERVEAGELPQQFNIPGVLRPLNLQLGNLAPDSSVSGPWP